MDSPKPRSQCVRSLPQLLNSSCEQTFLPKLEYFTSVGISAEDLARVVASNPMLLAHSLEKQIIPSHKLLTSMLRHKSVVAILRRESRIFLANHSTSVLPNIRLLRQVGMSQSCISMSLPLMTRLLILKNEIFAQLVGEAKEMGFDMKNSTSLRAMHVLWCKSTFNRSRQLYMKSWGWSEDVVLSAFRKCPRSMLVSEKKLMQVMDFLVNKMGCPSVIISKYPIVFSLSLKKRIIPRCSVFKVLLSKGLINKRFRLQSLLIPPEEKFLEMYVTKFANEIPQPLSLYQGKVGIQDVRC